MGRTGNLSFRRCVAAAMVAGGHLLLVVLIAGTRSPDTKTAQSGAQDRIDLLVLDLPPPVESAPAPAQEQKRRRAPVPGPRKQRIPGASAAAPAAEAPGGIPPVDWHSDAERIAQAKGAELLEELTRKCEAAAREGAPPPECPKRKHPFGWSPEPRKAGFQGLLPYVRLGKHCVVGLGFLRLRDRQTAASQRPLAR